MRYAAGIKLFILGERLRERFDILPVAREDLARLRDERSQPSTLTALVEDQVVVLEVLQGHAIVNFGTQAGTVLDLHASAHGKVALAFGPEGLSCSGALQRANQRGPRRLFAHQLLFNVPWRKSDHAVGLLHPIKCCMELMAWRHRFSIMLVVTSVRSRLRAPSNTSPRRLRRSRSNRLPKPRSGYPASSVGLRDDQAPAMAPWRGGGWTTNDTSLATSWDLGRRCLSTPLASRKASECWMLLAEQASWLALLQSVSVPPDVLLVSTCIPP